MTMSALRGLGGKEETVLCEVLGGGDGDAYIPQILSLYFPSFLFLIANVHSTVAANKLK